MQFFYPLSKIRATTSFKGRGTVSLRPPVSQEARGLHTHTPRIRKKGPEQDWTDATAPAAQKREWLVWANRGGSWRWGRAGEEGARGRLGASSDEESECRESGRGEAKFLAEASHEWQLSLAAWPSFGDSPIPPPTVQRPEWRGRRQGKKHSLLPATKQSPTGAAAVGRFGSSPDTEKEEQTVRDRRCPARNKKSSHTSHGARCFHMWHETFRTDSPNKALPSRFHRRQTWGSERSSNLPTAKELTRWERAGQLGGVSILFSSC